MSASSPVVINSTTTSPSLYPDTASTPVSPLIFASTQEVNGDVSPLFNNAPLPHYPFCDCPAHDTRSCTGPSDFPFCCPAHWAQESGNYTGTRTPDSLPSLVTIPQSEDTPMSDSIDTDHDDPLSSIHRTNNWIAQVHVNTTQITTSEAISDDHPLQWGNFAEISADPSPAPIPVVELNHPPTTYGKCWTCKMHKADHKRADCPRKKPMVVLDDTTPEPKTRKQRRADKKRPHKPIKVTLGRGPSGRKPIAPEWRRRSEPIHRFDPRTLDTIKKNTGLDLIALLEDYSIKMGRANTDIWNMRRDFIENVITHIRWEANTGRGEMRGRSNNGWATNSWGTAWA